MEASNQPGGQTLPRLQKYSYGVGHVLNDLCASMWFSYLLVFFHNVLEFSNVLAGYLMLLGQIADAIVTPFIGYESDHTDGFCRYGKRKSWHLVGVISVVCSFPFLFMVCLGCGNADDWAQFIYYAPFVVIFQFGWATTQISHLSIIPELTPCESERVELNSIRYAFTVISNIIVYGLAWSLLTFQNDGDSSSSLGPQDADKFRTLALTVVALGLVISILFHMGTKEKCSPDLQVKINGVQSLSATVDNASKPAAAFMQWKCWLKEVQFYQIAGVYMCTRLIVNVSQIYMPMYLTHSLELPKQYIAIIPLVVFVSGFISAIPMKVIHRAVGRKVVYILGLVCIAACAVWLWFLHEYTWPNTLMVIGPAILQGVGGTVILITSLSMTADLIGENTASGAFVYGAMSFTDKLSNGLAVVLIQHFHPCKGTEAPCCAKCKWYYRDCMVFIPGGVAVIALIVILTLLPAKIGRLRKLEKASTYNQFENGET